MSHAGPFDAAKGESTLSLAENGKALQPIIISAQAAEYTKTTAAELAKYLKQITGAEFEVKTGDGTSGIVLGTLVEFPNDKLKKPLEIRHIHDGKESFAIRTEPKRLLLISATDIGVSHVAFRFLELLGYRHFFPGKTWEVVPSTSDLRVSVQEDNRPKLLDRLIWFGYGGFSKQGNADYRDWQRHNRMGATPGNKFVQSMKARAGHSWGSVIRNNPEVFKEHPEYLALVNGKRGGAQICASNPGARKLIAERAVNSLTANPNEDMVSVGPSDGGGFCECPECAKWGSISNQVFFVANEAARSVQKAHPGKMVGLLAYSVHCDPPDFELEPNVYVQLTAGYLHSKFNYGFDELAQLWSKKVKHMGFYEYLSYWRADRDRPRGPRAANLVCLKQRIAFYVRNGTSLSCESSANWGPSGLGYYVTNRMMWDENMDVDALRQDFIHKAFGPAAKAMDSFYSRVVVDGMTAYPSRHWWGLAVRDLQQASTLAKGRPDVQVRLDHLKLYMHYVKLMWELDSFRGDRAKPEEAKVQRKELALRWFTHSYRIRNTYMTHWRGMQRAGAILASREFKDTSWHPESKGKRPYEVDTPITPAEIEQGFKEDLEYFVPIEVEERKFSDDLVPVRFEAHKPVAVNHIYTGTNYPYALYSVNGEPLKVTLTLGTETEHRLRIKHAAEEKKKAQTATQAQAKAQAQAAAPAPDAPNNNADKDGDVDAPVPPAAADEDDDDEGEEDLTPEVKREGRYRLTTPDGKIIREGKLPADFKAHPLELKVPSAGLYYFRVLAPDKDDAFRGGFRIELPAETPSAIVINKGTIMGRRHNKDHYYFYVPKGTKNIQYYWMGVGHRVFSPKDLADARRRTAVQAVPEGKRGMGHMVSILVPEGMDGQIWSMSWLNRAPRFFNIPTVITGSPGVVLLPRELAKKDGLTVVSTGK